jgi:integrase
MSLKLTFRKARSSKDKTKRGTYYIEGTDHRGRRVHKSLRTGDRDLAKSEFAKYVAASVAMRLEGPKGVVNFANAVKIYLERLALRGKAGTMNETFLGEMLPHIGTKKLCELTQADLDGLAKRLRPNCKASTVKRHIYTPFIAAYNAAVDHDPPLADPRRWNKPTVPKRKAHPPDDAYIATLKDAAYVKGRGKRNAVTGSRKPERDAALVLFMTLSGCRSGEAQRFAIGDFDPHRGAALLRKTKNGDPRRVALAPALISALVAQVDKLHERAAGKAPDSTLIFECETRWGIPQLFKRAQKRAGLDRRRPHEIGRHAFAKRILEAGESTLTVKDAGGWKTLRMVDEYYGHLARERTDQVVAGIDTRALQQSTPKSHPDQNASPAITDKQRKNVA